MWFHQFNDRATTKLIVEAKLRSFEYFVFTFLECNLSVNPQVGQIILQLRCVLPQ